MIDMAPLHLARFQNKRSLSRRRARSLIGEEGRQIEGVLSVLRSEFHPLLFLPLVAEPDANDVLLEVELLGDGGNLLAGGSRLDREVRLEAALLRRRNRRALALLLAGRKHARRVRVAPLVLRLRLGLLQPRLQDRLQRDHVVVRQRERLEAANRRLRQRAYTVNFEL